MIISSRKLENPVLVPSSKSYAARMLMAGMLSPSEIKITDIPKSQDSMEFINIVEVLGIGYWDKDSFIIDKSFPNDERESNSPIEIDLGEGGTTIRFLLSLLALGKNAYRLKVHPRFKSRPFQDQLNLLAGLGAKVELSDKEDELGTIQGPLKLPESIKIDCSQTTQVASSFLIIAHFHPVHIALTNINSSKAYIEMTKYVLQNLKSKQIVPVDMSSASSFIILASVLQDMSFPQILEVDQLQADSKVISLLKSCGCDLKFSPHLEVNKSNLKPFDIDGSQCLDLIPNLCFLAANIKGKSVIRNIENLHYKESDRVAGICHVLDQFGVKFKVVSDSIEIYGEEILKNTQVIETSPDHRIVMLASLFLKITGGGEVQNAQTVSKSNSKFFEILN